jgi:hypothetical protein
MEHIEAAIAAIKDSDYSYFGIRATDEVLTVGAHCQDSRVWDDGDATDETLDGASATKISLNDYTDTTIKTALAAALEANKPYRAAHHYIIASDSMEYGEDTNEIILRDAVVVAVID